MTALRECRRTVQPVQQKIRTGLSITTAAKTLTFGHYTLQLHNMFATSGLSMQLETSRQVKGNQAWKQTLENVTIESIVEWGCNTVAARESGLRPKRIPQRATPALSTTFCPI